MPTPRKKKVLPIIDPLSGINPILQGDEEKIFALLKNSSLENLNLNSSKIQNMERFIEALVELRKSPIKEINLSHSTFNNRDVDEVIQMLGEIAKNKNLSKINLSEISFRTPFTPEAFKRRLNELDPSTRSNLKDLLAKNLLQINKELKPAIIQLGASPLTPPFLPSIPAKKEYKKSSRANTKLSNDFSATENSPGDENNEVFQSPYGRTSAQSLSRGYEAYNAPVETVDLGNGDILSLDDLRLFNNVVTEVFNNNPRDPAQIKLAKVLQNIEDLDVASLTEHFEDNQIQETAQLIKNIVEKDPYLKNVYLNDNKFTSYDLKIIINGLINAKLTPGSKLTGINLKNSIQKNDLAEISGELKQLKATYTVKLSEDIKRKLSAKSVKLPPLPFFNPLPETGKSNKIVLPPIEGKERKPKV